VTATAQQHDAGEIARMLAARTPSLARELLPAGRRDGQEWRCGSLAGERGGSLGVRLTGQKAGVWQDFATGETGDALDLVAAVLYRGDRREALRWSRQWLGLGDSGAAAPLRAATPAPRSSPDDEAEQTARVRAAALALWLAARPTIADTPVDHYLRARGIDLSRLGGQPRALRFHPGLHNVESQRTWPAMVAAISGGDGAHVATHRTWLATDRAGVWRKAPLSKQKMVLGRMQGGSIRLWRGASGRSLSDALPDELIVIGEGIETCLSIVVAVPEARVLASVSLGNLGRIVLPPQIRRVTIAADNDTAPEAKRGLALGQNALMDRGLEVRVARSPIGSDFNDALRSYA
jgi:Toprim domain